MHAMHMNCMDHVLVVVSILWMNIMACDLSRLDAGLIHDLVFLHMLVFSQHNHSWKFTDIPKHNSSHFAHLTKQEKVSVLNQ